MRKHSAYDPDLLTETAVSATSHVDMLRRLGIALGPSTLRYLRSRIEHYKIDTSHFTDEELPARPRRSYPKWRLEELL